MERDKRNTQARHVQKPIEERSLSINIIAEVLFLVSQSSIGYLFYLICGPSAVP